MTISQAANWQVVAQLRPQLRQHVRTYPQIFRSQRWYVLHDESNGRNLRFNATAYAFIGRLDGNFSVQQIWQQLATADAEPALQQDEVLLILTQLFAIDALQSGLPIDAMEFFKRYQHERRLRRKRAVMNPLAIRVPLLDPDALLNRLLPWVRPLFSTSAALLWLLLVGLATLLAMVNFPALHAALDRDLLAPTNLLLLLLTFILIKGVHEFAHAFAVKMWGGEVHEMGITLLVLAPVPYVDASAAWGFRDKHKRVLVGAVGILVELFVAALALFVWLSVEPGLVRDAAFNALLIGSVSTLLFNANPLLRFDAYYVLQDLIEIPNLYSRASRYYLYLLQRYLFGLTQVPSPVSADGERGWFLCYGLATLLYRLFILVVIVLFLADEYLFLGVLLGTWAIGMQLLVPLLRGVRFVLAAPALAGRRVRAATFSVLLLSGLAGGLCYLPVSLTTHTEGIVWVPEQAQVFAATDGFVSQVLVASGTEVAAGTPLIRLRAPALEARIAVLKARYRTLQTRHAAEQLQQRVASTMTAEEMAALAAELSLLRAQVADLEVRSALAGSFVRPEAHTLQGRYLRQGELIGYLITPARLIVRAVVPQSAIGLVRQQVQQVEVRLAERLDETIVASIVRETPSGSTDLPSRALGAAGGGDIAVRKTDAAGTTAAEKVFQLDLSLPDDLAITGLGERAYVLFDHGAEPLARQWLRSGRQLVLSRLSL